MIPTHRTHTLILDRTHHFPLALRCFRRYPKARQFPVTRIPLLALCHRHTIMLPRKRFSMRTFHIGARGCLSLGILTCTRGQLLLSTRDGGALREDVLVDAFLAEEVAARGAEEGRACALEAETARVEVAQGVFAHAELNNVRAEGKSTAVIKYGDVSSAAMIMSVSVKCGEYN